MRVLILGLGQYSKGSGISAALWFAHRGEEVVVTDLKSESELTANVRRLKKYSNVRFTLGRHDLADVVWADLIVRGPRVRPDAPEMIEARRLGKHIESDITLFLDACPAKVIGVTGTRGKSTTATLLAQMLKADGRRVWLGGNILVSPLTFLSRVKAGDWVVLELSSWQLEQTGERGVSPAVAVWTNLMHDHLNTYGSLDEYAEAKAQIFRHQLADGLVFLPSDKAFNVYADEAAGRVVRFGRSSSLAARLVASTKLKIVGEHNLRNALTAATVALELGVSPTAIHRALRLFPGLPHRQEEIALIRGVRFINDTTSTTPDATLAALKTFAPVTKGKLYLIFGGADKELEFDEVARCMRRSRVQVLVLPGTAFSKVSSALEHACVAWEPVKDLLDARRKLAAVLRRGDTVLLSPGCASFGLFKNEFDRGQQFKRLAGWFASREKKF